MNPDSWWMPGRSYWVPDGREYTMFNSGNTGEGSVFKRADRERPPKYGGVQQVSEFRVRVPEGTLFSNIVFEFGDRPTSEYAVTEIGVAPDFLTLRRNMVLTVVERPNLEHAKLQEQADEARREVEKAHQALEKAREVLEEKRRVKNRTRSALEKFERQGRTGPRNPFI